MKTNFRKEINDLRKKHKVSLSDLAKMADVSYSALWKFLGGKEIRTDIKASNLEKVFDVFINIEKRKTKKKWVFPSENFNR